MRRKALPPLVLAAGSTVSKGWTVGRGRWFRVRPYSTGRSGRYGTLPSGVELGHKVIQPASRNGLT